MRMGMMMIESISAMDMNEALFFDEAVVSGCGGLGEISVVVFGRMGEGRDVTLVLLQVWPGFNSWGS